jgi:hypothetical protein
MNKRFNVQAGIFTASNGLKIHLTNAYKTGYTVHPGKTASSSYLSFEEMVAWREFFRAERDEELGRWRSPQYPDYVVYPVDENTVRVSNETNGFASKRLRSEIYDTPQECFDTPEYVALAYFDAHPEPKPWHDAKPGQVWALTLEDDDGSITEMAAFKDGEGLWRSVLSQSVIQDPFITEGHLIWPEGD